MLRRALAIFRVLRPARSPHEAGLVPAPGSAVDRRMPGQESSPLQSYPRKTPNPLIRAAAILQIPERRMSFGDTADRAVFKSQTDAHKEASEPWRP